MKCKICNEEATELGHGISYNCNQEDHRYSFLYGYIAGTAVEKEEYIIIIHNGDRYLISFNFIFQKTLIGIYAGLTQNIASHRIIIDSIIKLKSFDRDYLLNKVKNALAVS